MTTKYRDAVSRNAALLAAAILLVLSAATALSVHAAEPNVERQSTSIARLFGERATSVEGARTVLVTPEAKSVQVHAGETVRFDFGATSAGWSFAARPGNTVVELVNLFPDIHAAKGVWVHQNGSMAFQGH
ncbi:CzcE family metal-binding protein [Cupriavidus sp. CP313]